METKRVYAPSEGILLPDGTPASRKMRPVQAAALSMVGSLAAKTAHDFIGELQEMLNFQQQQADAGETLTKGQQLCLDAVKVMATCQLAGLKLVSSAVPQGPQDEPEDDTPKLKLV